MKRSTKIKIYLFRVEDAGKQKTSVERFCHARVGWGTADILLNAELRAQVFSFVDIKNMRPQNQQYH